MANEPTFPASFCETLGWIGDWPLGLAFDKWSGTATEPPPVAMFLAEFSEIVRHLEGGSVLLSGDLSLDEARRAARKRTCQLIVQFREVPAGWEDEFTVNLPGIEPFVAFPSRPIRTANEVLEFMAEKGKQASLNNLFTPPELRERAFRDAIKGAVLWLVDYGHAKPSTLIREHPTDLLELFKVFDNVRDKVKDVSAREQLGGTAVSLPTDVARPISLAEFATWIDSLLTELESREGDEPIGESGKAHMPVAASAKSPAVSVVTLHQPSRLYVIREQLWDGLEKFAPPNVVDELLEKYPPEKVKTVRRLRRLIVASKSAVEKAIAEERLDQSRKLADIGGVPLVVTQEQMSRIVANAISAKTMNNRRSEKKNGPKPIRDVAGTASVYRYAELAAWIKTEWPAVSVPDETEARKILSAPV